MHAIYNFVQNSSGTSYTLLLCSPSPLPLLCGSMLVVGELLVNPLPLRSIPNDTNKISLISSTYGWLMNESSLRPLCCQLCDARTRNAAAFHKGKGAVCSYQVQCGRSPDKKPVTLRWDQQFRPSLSLSFCFFVYVIKKRC
jgi:hypothetical protein